MQTTTVTDTRSEILATALELFGRRGYEGTPLREIADRLGITKAALYYHFPAKEDILLAVVDPLIERVRGLLADAWPNRPRDPAAVLEAYLDLVVDVSESMAFALREPAVRANPRIAPRVWELTMGLRDALAGPGAGEQAKLRAACALGAINAGAATVPSERMPRLRRVLLEAALGCLSGR